MSLLSPFYFAYLNNARLEYGGNMSQKRAHSPDSGDGEEQIYRSQPIEDRTSTFLALYTPSTTTTPKNIQSSPEIEDATHKILAWRKPGKQHTLTSSGTTGGRRVLFDSGHDDDGESYAGKKLENLLWQLDVAGTVVVARWYGGVLLGPVRFEHMVNVAKEAIGEWKTQVEEKVKRRKVAEEEEREKTRLVKVLKERDASVEVLRGLLAEKKGETGPGKKEEGKKVDYEGMMLETLRRLERARDGTIRWILGQIDKVEQEEEKKRREGEEGEERPKGSDGSQAENSVVETIEGAGRGVAHQAQDEDTSAVANDSEQPTKTHVEAPDTGGAKGDATQPP